MDAACVLAKTRGGGENHAYLHKSKGEEKLRGGD